MTERKTVGAPAGEWEKTFCLANVAVDKLDAAKSERAKATLIGNVLRQHLDREVTIETADRKGSATLRREADSSKRPRYYFEVRWDSDAGDVPDDVDRGERAESGGGGSPGKTRKRRKGPAKKVVGPVPSRRRKNKAQKEEKLDHGGNNEAW